LDVGVYCLDVGQANCLAVVDPLPGGRPEQFQVSLIDIGTDGDLLADWLDSIGVRKIAVIALTHNDEDHIRGLAKLVYRFNPSPRREPRIGQVFFLVDRDPAEIPFYLDAQSWVRDHLIAQVARLEAPDNARPGMGATLIKEPNATYRLHCAFPIFPYSEAVSRSAPSRSRVGTNPNDTSGVIRLARPTNPRRTRILFGGDLSYPGWQMMVDNGLDLQTDVLVAPHHGAPRGSSRTFGPAELAAETRPGYTLFSVGTRQRHVNARNEALARHPLSDVVKAFRLQGTLILCTQISRRCHNDPDNVPGNSVIPLPSIISPHNLSTSGSACAGTIMLVLRDTGRLVISRLADHRDAVDALRPTGHHPMCRP
jgi:beta-lactamase superfamily II metal-dependent hydrolase